MEDKIKEILYSDGNIIEKYEILYREYMLDNENCCTNFKRIIDVSNNLTRKQESDLTEEQEDQLTRAANYYFLYIKSVVDVLSKKNDIEEDFYKKLYEKVFNSDLIETEGRYGIILYILARKVKKLPYYQGSNPLCITDDKFDSIIDDVRPDIEKALYMIDDRFESFTEEASQIYDIAVRMGNREKASVFLAAVIGTLKRGVENDSEKE